MSVKLSDIAKETGFSVNTVSRALRNDSRISPETSKLIQTKAKELGYIRNILAGSMRSSRTRTIGVISADSSNPFFAEVILGIEDEARSRDYSILLTNTEEREENEYHAVKLLLGRQVDGLIAIPVYDSERNRELYSNLPVPFLFAGRHIPGMIDHSILHADAEGSEMVFRHLLGEGHERILYLAGPRGISSREDRLQGLRAAYERENLAVDGNLIFDTDGHIDGGYGTMNRILNRGIEFTAVACFNDLVAMGALKSLHESSLKVPDDVEVFGYDNLSISRYMQPRLSSVDIPKARLGQLAVRELIAHIEDENRPYATLNMEPRLVFRESTRRRARED